MLRGGQLSFISQVLGRQLEGGAVHKRPFVAEFRCEGACSGTVINNPGLTGTPAFAAEYSRVYNDSKLLAIADEEGFVSIVDTSAELPSEMADDEGPNKPKAQWLAHRNAVFDIAWCHHDSRMLTASGDQTLGLWDTGHADALGSFRGHSGSVKAVAPLPHNNAVFASGARDGALMLWDARAAARADGVTGEPFHSPVATVHDAHALGEKHRRRRTPLQGRTRPSVTSLAFLGGTGSQLATGGVDGIVKFWDLRQTGGATCEADPGLQLARLCDASAPHISQKQHGITSLSLHPQGSQLLVSLMGGHHLVYDPLRPAIGPTRWFGGHTVASFYVKAAWSPDGSHILSGSTDRCAYVWEVDAPDGASPYVLSGHQGEVTSVAWCPSDFHQIATIADDATLKVWHIQRRQPEEQADDGTPRLPWVYPWQQQRQLEAAAAAAAACDGAARGAGDTPGTAPHGADEPGSAPWTSAAASAAEQRSGGGRGVPSTVRGGRRAAGSAGDENRHTNLARSPLQQQQHAQAHADAGLAQRERQQLAAADGQQQQHWAASHRADAGRPQPYLTPSAAATARGGGAAGSPLAAAGSTLPATAGPSSRRMRRVGDLLQSAPSTRRRTQQTSIAAFLHSPATGAVRGGAPSPCPGTGAGSTLPRPACGTAGRTTARKRGGRVAGGSSAGPPLPLALPGLGGSGLPLADQRSKRLRVSFERAGSSAEPTATACPTTALQRQQGPGPGGACAAAQLEPSPELAAKLGAGMVCSGSPSAERARR